MMILYGLFLLGILAAFKRGETLKESLELAAMYLVLVLFIIGACWLISVVWFPEAL